jgi:hypothetical protein
MPSFTFTFPVVNTKLGTAPTADQLKSRAEALRKDLGALTLTLKFTDTGDRKGTFTATGTAANLGAIESNAATAVENLPGTAGWLPDDVPKFGADDPTAPGGRRRRRSRRQRKRRSTRR